MEIRRILNTVYWINLPIMSITVLLPLFSINLGFSPLKTTGLTAAFSLCLLLTKAASGLLCDKIGRVYVFRFGGVLAALSYLSLAYSTDGVGLYTSQMIKGVALSLTSVSAYVMLTEDSNSEAAINMGKLAGAEGRGGLVGCLLMIPIFSVPFLVGWNRYFISCSIIAIIAVFRFTFGKSENKKFHRTNSVNLREMLTPYTKILVATNTLCCLSLGTVSSIAVLFLNIKFGSDMSAIISALFIPAIIVTFLKPKIGHIASKKNGLKGLITSLAATAVCMLVIPFVNTPVEFGIIWTGSEITTSFCTIFLSSL